MMRRPWSQPVKLNKNTGHGLWMCWLEQAQQLCVLFALRTTLTFATKLHQPRWYLSTAQPPKAVTRCWRSPGNISFNYWLELDSNPLPQPSFLWLSFFQPKSLNNNRKKSFLLRLISGAALSSRIVRLLECILRILTAFPFPFKQIYCLSLEETSAGLLPAATQSLTLHKLTEKE